MINYLNKLICFVLLFCLLGFTTTTVYNEIKPQKYIITGICSTEMVNAYGLRVLSRAFETDIASFQGVPLLVNHDKRIEAIVGRVTELYQEGRTTYFRAEIRATWKNRALIQQILHQELTDVSIGIKIHDQIKGALTEVELIEISLVYAGADPGAKITNIRLKP